MFEDLSWFGLRWHEGPDVGGPFGPYSQSQRRQFYVEAFKKLQAGGFLYPCSCSRQDVLRALQAPHQSEDEPIYPGTCRPKSLAAATSHPTSTERAHTNVSSRINWRFRVPDGEAISFIDGHYGPLKFVAGTDFGDFIVWRHDDIPAYHLAVVADDSAMRITEVVRGEDLLKSTARQLLLYRALGYKPPLFYHCALMTDKNGVRLAKRHDALSLRALRSNGATPATLRESWITGS